MTDQRILSLAALVLFIAAILLPWPILAVGRTEPAIAFAATAALASLGFAWLGRSDSLGRLVFKLTCGVGAMVLAIAALVSVSAALDRAQTARVQARIAREHALVAEEKARDVAEQAQLKAEKARQETAQERAARQAAIRRVKESAAATIPDVAPGPDPMPILRWPAIPAVPPADAEAEKP